LILIRVAMCDLFLHAIESTDADRVSDLGSHCASDDWSDWLSHYGAYSTANYSPNTCQCEMKFEEGPG
jgi:hypothetical protein